MIPEFNTDGNLPVGIYSATYNEVEKRFGVNVKRQWLLEGLHTLLLDLQSANCKVVYLDGSFVTDKTMPGDYDLCWSITDIDLGKLNKKIIDLTPTGRQIMKQHYRGDIFPAEVPEGASGKAFLDFFQIDKNTGNQKGIVEIKLGAIK